MCQATLICYDELKDKKITICLHHRLTITKTKLTIQKRSVYFYFQRFIASEKGMGFPHDNHNYVIYSKIAASLNGNLLLNGILLLSGTLHLGEERQCRVKCLAQGHNMVIHLGGERVCGAKCLA